MKARTNFTLDADLIAQLQNHVEMGYASMSAMVEAALRRLLGEDGARPSQSMSVEEITKLIEEKVAALGDKAAISAAEEIFYRNKDVIRTQIQQEVYADIMKVVDERTGFATSDEDFELMQSQAEESELAEIVQTATEPTSKSSSNWKI